MESIWATKQIPTRAYDNGPCQDVIHPSTHVILSQVELCQTFHSAEGLPSQPGCVEGVVMFRHEDASSRLLCLGPGCPGREQSGPHWTPCPLLMEAGFEKHTQGQANVGLQL